MHAIGSSGKLSFMLTAYLTLYTSEITSGYLSCNVIHITKSW